MTSNKERVCIIGAGPCGVSTLFHFGQLPRDSAPEVVCFEKQQTWGGLWNYSWMTGTDEHGEPCHAGMYKHLWSNGPKEGLEFPEYTFEEHFGRAIPSFPPRIVLRDYLLGRWKKSNINIESLIRYNTVVKSVDYNEASDDFTVTVKNLKQSKIYSETFNYVVVANGIFNCPNKPYLNGIEKFTGRVLHAHDFRDATEFKGQTVLLVGASYSAEDIAMQLKKFGAKKAICTWRTKPMGFHWPEGIEERPLVQNFEGNTAFFKDGTTSDFDAVILCTGYLYSFPFLPDNLRLESGLTVYPKNLYKGMVWMNGGNNKLFYIGVQDQYFTFTMFDVQSLWICKSITGQIPQAPRKKMEEEVAKWVKRAAGLKDCYDDIEFQADFIEDLSKDVGYNMDVSRAGRKVFTEWENHKHKDVSTYRDQPFVSIFTGTKSPKHVHWFQAMDDSLEAFVGK